MKHYIPIKEDLSDLIERLTWCKDNEEICEIIALNGKELAKNIVFNLDKDIDSAINAYFYQFMSTN